MTCTACGGSFQIEFTWLSLLTGDNKYQKISRKAMRSLWKYKTELGLFGSHIDVSSVVWVYPECSIGGGVDSFYEYMLKSYVGFSDEDEFDGMFLEVVFTFFIQLLNMLLLELYCNQEVYEERK